MVFPSNRVGSTAGALPRNSQPVRSLPLKRLVYPFSISNLSSSVSTKPSVANNGRKEAAQDTDRKSGIENCWEVPGAGPINRDKVLRCGKRVEEPTCAQGGKENGEPHACVGSVVPAVLRIVRLRTQFRLKV